MIADLPATREEGNQTFVSNDGTKHKFFMVGVGSPCLLAASRRSLLSCSMLRPWGVPVLVAGPAGAASMC